MLPNQVVGLRCLASLTLFSLLGGTVGGCSHKENNSQAAPPSAATGEEQPAIPTNTAGDAPTGDAPTGDAPTTSGPTNSPPTTGAPSVAPMASALPPLAPVSPSDATTSGSADDSTTGTREESGTASTTAGSTESTDSTVDVTPGSNEPAVRFVGRFHDTGAGAMSFEWSGSGMVAAFEGTTVSVNLTDSGNNEFTVLVDGEEKSKLSAQAGNNDYPLATGLTPGPHTVELYRRTEASFGTTTFHGFDFGPDGRLLPAPSHGRRLEIIGDSISCGYGIEGASAMCGFTADTENHYATYGALAARALDAEVVTIAWSGKGIVYNYDTDRTDPLPALYDRTLPSDPGSSWDFSVVPDAVVINLGTNDFSTDDDPPADLFHDEYVQFLEHLRDVYPTTFILATVGPLLNDADLDAARTGIESAVGARQAAGDSLVASWRMNIANDNPGCDYHPGLATHQAMADALVSELQTHLDW